MNENPFVGLAGNIGVGKTTFTEKMAEAGLEKLSGQAKSKT